MPRAPPQIFSASSPQTPDDLRRLRRRRTGGGTNQTATNTIVHHMNHSEYQLLSQGRKALVRQMQQINFGRIECLGIKNGEPVLDPPPKIVREIKFGGDNGPRHETDSRAFVLKAQVVELFHQLDGIASGQIELLEIKHGLPFRMLVGE